MQSEFLKQVVETLIFASDVPLSAKQLRSYIEEMTVSELEKVVDELNMEYKQTKRSFQIVRIGGGFQMVSRESFAPWIQKLYQKRRKSKLSQAALETLSVIAFKQPVSRSEIDGIRGVNSDGVLRTLLERKLIKISGRAEGPGRPLLYMTTNDFLQYFGVNDLTDLPKPREIEEILKEEKHLPEDATE